MIKLCACLRAQPGFISLNDQSAISSQRPSLRPSVSVTLVPPVQFSTPPPVLARSAHAALPWMAELAARRYSPSPERWIEHPQNPFAFDPRQRDDLTGRQIGLRPAWGRPAGAQQRRLPLRYKRLAKIINLAENL